MKIGGNDSIDSICYGHWKKMSAELNLGFPLLLKRLQALCKGTLNATMQALALPQGCAAVLRLIQKRAVKIAQMTCKP